MKLCEIFSLTRYDQKMYIYVTNAYDQNVCLGRGTRYDIICDVANVDNILPHMLDEVNMVSVTPDGGMQILVRDAMYKKPLEEQGIPIKAIFPGRCFRNEATDACHENTFFQMEGMMVDKDISISNLIYFMKTMLSEVFQKDIKVRLRPGFFPFVEPGFELDISCLICGGEGCPSCKHSGWLELCPCGMIHPEVLKMGGIDPEKYTGFAFGLGLTRLVMMKYGIKDIRDLNGGSLKAMSQFTDDE